MTTLNKLHIALAILKEIPYMDRCDMIGTVQRESIPESYSLREEIVMHGYRLAIYDMGLLGKKSYFVDIKQLGYFQIM
jgi:hypothetical protein